MKKTITILIVVMILISSISIISCGGSSKPATESSSTPVEEMVSEESSTSQAATMLHSTEGRENCLMCHGEGKTKPFPSDHAGRQNDGCLTCHRS